MIGLGQKRISHTIIPFGTFEKQITKTRKTMTIQHGTKVKINLGKAGEIFGQTHEWSIVNGRTKYEVEVFTDDNGTSAILIVDSEVLEIV